MNVVRIGIGAASLLALFAATPASAQAEPSPASGPDCEIHVWGAGRPNLQMPPRVEAIIRRSNTPEMLDRANPLSNVNVFNTVKRAAALPDEALHRLMPDARSVTIIRHDTIIDTDLTPLKAIRAPIASSSTACYADLVVANVYAIFPDPNGPYATSLIGFVVGSALVGSDRLVIDFWYQRFSERAGRPVTLRKKDDTPLPHVRFATPEMAEAVTISSAANLGRFADFVASRSGGRRR